MSLTYPPRSSLGGYVPRAFVTRARVAMGRVIEARFAELADDTARQISRAVRSLKSASSDARDIVNGLDLEFDTLVDDVERHYASVAVGGGALTLDRLGPGFLEQFGAGMRVRARNFAADRAAELVGRRRRADGELIDNPRAQYAITDQTRAELRSLVETAIADGDSVDVLAGRIREAHAFSAARARTIARTEIAKADSVGSLLGWDETGVVTAKSWLTTGDDLVSDACISNAAEGRVELFHDYGDGVLAPPEHPNCRCVVLAYTD